MKTTLLKITISFFLALAIIACGGGEAAQNNSENSNDSTAVKDSTQKAENPADKNANKQDEELVPVEVATVTTGEISNYILLSSNLETEVQADVYPRAQGIVERILKDEGDYVNKGALLVKLEAKEYEIAEQKARVDYQKQESIFERQKVMHSEQLLSDEEFDQVKYTKDAAKYTWEDAKLRLDYMSIQSPISGYIGERLTKIGARVQPSDKLFSIVNKKDVIAVVYVPEKNINVLKPAMDAFITSENLNNKAFKARVKRISPVVDPASGTFKVTVEVMNENEILKPGMFVNVHLVIDTHKNAVLVPKTAVVYENEYINVFVVRDSVAHKIKLDTGFEDSMKIEALSEIKEGDKVIVVGQAGMKDKTKVRIVLERESSIAAATK
jgi:membrane fusion protein, multidrug efflux system